MGCAASQPVSSEQSARVKTDDKPSAVGDTVVSKQAQQRKLAADDQGKHEKGSAANEPPARDVDTPDSFYTPDNSDDERSRKYDTSMSRSGYATSIASSVSTRSMSRSGYATSIASSVSTRSNDDAN